MIEDRNIDRSFYSYVLSRGLTRRSRYQKSWIDGYIKLLAVVGMLSFAIAPPSFGQSSGQSSSPREALIEGFSIEPPVRMQGKNLPWNHEVQIALPPSYGTTDKAYPVLWLTDGHWRFEAAIHAAASVNDKIPEMIIVAVGSPPEAASEVSARRSYDFSPFDEWGASNAPGSDILEAVIIQADERRKSLGQKTAERLGGAGHFQTFLVDQLRPILARRYRFSGVNIYSGHSGGCRFGIYTLLTRPDSFDKYICSSPALYLGEMVLFQLEKSYAQTHTDLKADVFLAVGEDEIMQDAFGAYGIVSSTIRMVEILTVRNYPSLNLTFRIFEEKDHGTVAPVSFDWGLQAAWEDE